MRERLDMLSASRQIGFFSDAYTIEWSYAKAVMVRRVLSRVLAEKILAGQYDKSGALAIGREILFEAPRSLLGMEPAAARVKGTAKRAGASSRAGKAAAPGG